VNDDVGFSKSSILVSFLAGGLTGAAVALLLAPQSGQRARGRINQRIQDGLDRGRKAKARMASKGHELLENGSTSPGTLQEDLDQRHNRAWKTGGWGKAEPVPATEAATAAD
jgi:gas vesicle protein